MRLRLFWFSAVIYLFWCGAAVTATPCRIEITDNESGWPVPLVELKTTHGVKFVSDNAGIVAFDLPELMGRETWLEVRSH